MNIINKKWSVKFGCDDYFIYCLIEESLVEYLYAFAVDFTDANSFVDF